MLNGHPALLAEVVGPFIPFSVLEYVFPQATLNWSQGDYRGIVLEMMVSFILRTSFWNALHPVITFTY